MAVATAVLAAHAHAQEQRVIHDQVACAGCAIDVEHLVRLGGPDDTAYVSWAITLPRDRRGRIFFHSAYERGTIAVFDRDARLVGKLGREGGGPGEFAGPLTLFIGPGDSLHVFDVGNARETVFTPSLEAARMTRLPLVPRDVAWRRGGGAIFYALERSAARFGRPLHLVTRDREVVRSFGDTEPVITPENHDLMRRRLAAAGDGGFWAAHVHDYAIERYDADGTLVRTLRREADWFPRTDRRPEVPLSADGPRPAPAIIDIQEDAAGRLWVFLIVADDDWQRAFRESTERGAHGVLPIRTLLRDAVIEVIDPAAGIVLARHRMDEFPMGFSARGVVFTYNDDGLYEYLNIRRVRLSHPTDGGTT